MKVIGVTGTIGSGKSIVREFLIKRFNCYCVLLSSVIKTEGRKKKTSRRELQDLGNELRKKYGAHILAKLAVDYLQKNKEMAVIDGIRNPAEAEFLKKTFGNNFFLIAVDAPKEIRFERLLKRGTERDPKNYEEFIEMDEREMGKGEPEYGQQVEKCMKMADFLLINDGRIEEVESKLDEILKKIMAK
ncbi:MAG: AAA family ATPase [Candidatus Aenigmatarchaeota archaeon]